jgi:hypothetical protein
MFWSEIKSRATPRLLRQFAVLWLVALGLLAGLQGWLWERWAVAAVLAALAVGAGVPGVLWPRAVRWLYVGLCGATFPVGWVVSHLTLALVFYGLLTPLGLVFRLSGRDALGLRAKADRDSYWEPRPAASDPPRYLRQY